MSYDTEFSAGADFQQVIKTLDNVAKAMYNVEKAAERGFGNAEKAANGMGKSFDRLATMAFVSRAMNSAGNFLSSSLQAAAEDSKELKAQLDQVEKSWHKMKAGIGGDLMTQAVGGNAAEVVGVIDAASKSRGAFVDFLADWVNRDASRLLHMGGMGAYAGGLDADLAAGGAAQIRKDQAASAEMTRRAGYVRQLQEQYKSLEKAAARADMSEDARGRAEAMDRYNDSMAKAADLFNASLSADGYDRAEAAAKRILDFELQGVDAKAEQARYAEMSALAAAEELDRQRERQRLHALDQLAGGTMSMGIDTLRELGADRDAQRLQQRMQAVDALDALQQRTDITADDKARMRGELAHASQWKKDALELRFMADDERLKQVVSSRGFGGGLAGANAGVSAAALSGSLDPSLKAAQQTAMQTKESARLLAEIEKNLRKREAAVYSN